MTIRLSNAGRMAALLALVVVSGAAFAASGGTGSGTASAVRGDVACEIEVSRRGSSVALTALAHGDRSTGGEYSLAVSGSGTQIRQGGPFEVAAGRSATLGSVGLSAGRRYDVALDLTVGGRTVSCRERIGGA